MQNFKQQLHVPPTHLCSDLKRLKTKSKMLLQNWLQHNRTLVWAMLTNKIHNLFRSTTLQKGRNCQFCPFHVRLGVPVPNEPWLAKSRRSGVMQHKQGYSFCAWSLWTSLVRGLASATASRLKQMQNGRFENRQTQNSAPGQDRSTLHAPLFSLLLLPRARLRSLGKKKQQPSLTIKSPTKQRKVESFSSLNHFSSFAPLLF